MSGQSMAKAEPGSFFFGPKARPLFGWLHSPTAPRVEAAPEEMRASPSPHAPRVGVVLCYPFGFEASCTFRSVRHFAESFAQAGFPALRFDYDGTGDSAGDDRDPDRVSAWVSSIHASIEILKARAGVTQVVLFGVRLGATLAALAAVERTDCPGLIALAPVALPAMYLRELGAFQAWGKFEKSPDGISGLAEGDQEAAGFVITAETAKALSGIDLTKMASAPAARVLVLDRPDRPVATAWAERLRGLGIDVDVRKLAGITEMNADPHVSVVPTQIVQASTAWLSALLASAPFAAIAATDTMPAYANGAEDPREAPAPSGASPDADLKTGLVAGGVVETGVFVDGTRTLFGILARPSTEVPSRHAIVLLNAGAQHRIGPNRLWVKFARSWAERGIIVLRLDLSGIGDSRPRPGKPENDVYTDAGPADIADAVAYLRKEWGAERLEVVGLCGSAYHAFKAAAHGVDVGGVVSVNQASFFWEPNVPKYLAPNATASEVSRYRQTVFSREAWKKLANGDVEVRAVGRIFRQRFIDLAAIQARRVAGLLNLPIKKDLPTELRAIAKKETRLRFLFSKGEAGLQLLKELGGPTLNKLQRAGLVSVDIVQGPDHTFTPVWTHRILSEKLEGYLGIPPKRSLGLGADAGTYPTPPESRRA